MFSSDPQRSIVYDPAARPSAVLSALLVWTGLLYGAALLPLAYFAVLRRSLSPLQPFRWRSATETDLQVALVVIGLLALLVVFANLFQLHVEEQGGSEEEARQLLVGLRDATALPGWDRLLIAAPPLVVFPLAVMGLAGPVELLLALAVSGGIAVSSRKLPRFPPEPQEARLPYQDERIAGLLETPESDEVTPLRYRWRFRERAYLPATSEHEFEFSIPFRRARYDAARENPPTIAEPADYAQLVREDLAAPEVGMVAASLRRIHREQGYSPPLEVASVLEFVRQFELLPDSGSPARSRPGRHAVETLWDRAGRGECHTLLAATLLTLLGHEPVLLVLDIDPGTGPLVLALPGAEEMPEALRFLELDGRRHFCCAPVALSSGDRRSWTWHIGPLPDNESARVIPVRLDGVRTS